MFAQVSADLVERTGRYLGPVAQARHQLAVIDDEAAEGGFGGLRRPAKFADFAQNFFRGPAERPDLMLLDPHGFAHSPRSPSLYDNEETTGGTRQPQTKWAGLMGICPQLWARFRHGAWRRVDRLTLCCTNTLRSGEPASHRAHPSPRYLEGNIMGAIYSDLAGKVVLVTGGASGIGEAIVRRFAQQKSVVVFFDIKVEEGTGLARELSGEGFSAHFQKVDLTDIAALRNGIAEARRAHGPINVLVNNAAHDERHRTEDMTPEYWDDRVAVNLKHSFFAAQAVLPDMKAAQAGAIVNFSSISWMAGQGGMAAYTASKSAMLGLTRSLARDYGPYNIRVNAVAPGWIMTERQIEKWLTPEGEEELLRRQCLKRKLIPDEIAKFVVFLASDEASACTSQHYVVDGGWV